MKHIIALAILVLVSCVQAQVLGIDFGTEFWKAALISPGKNLVIVENSRSERKTLNSVTIAYIPDRIPRRHPILLRRLQIKTAKKTRTVLLLLEQAHQISGHKIAHPWLQVCRGYLYLR